MPLATQVAAAGEAAAHQGAAAVAASAWVAGGVIVAMLRAGKRYAAASVCCPFEPRRLQVHTIERARS